MGKASRVKGARGELEVAELLRAWWDPLEAGCAFKRSPASGGWSSPSDRKAFRLSGDLCTTALRFPFVVEIKRREGWTEKTLRAGKRTPVWGWWKQAQASAEERGAIPLLVFRKSRTPWLAMMPDYHARDRTFALLRTVRRYPARSLPRELVGDYLPALFPLAVLLCEHPRCWALAEK